MKVRMFAAMVILLGCSVLASPQSKDETAVREVLTRNTMAFERADMATLDNIWANDPTVIVIENGHANYGWQDYRDHHLAAEIKEFKNTKYVLTDVKIKIDTKTAWATFKYSIGADVKGRRIEGAGLGTAILEKRNGQWVIVHWHTSAPRRAASAAPAAKPAQ